MTESNREQKQEPGAPTFEPSAEYQARRQRLDAAMHMQRPDRIPVVPLVIHYYPTRVRGISNADAMYHMDRTLQAWRDATLEHDWDAAPPAGPVPAAQPLELLGVKQLAWPGGAIADNLPFQWIEGEYMMQEEYDELLADPNGFTVKKLWPRVSNTLTPVSEMLQAPPLPLLLFSNAYSLPRFLGNKIAHPRTVELLEKALELARVTRRQNTLVKHYTREMMALGFPFAWSGVTFTAFDNISDTLRGMRGTMLDMYQVPDKLLALIDLFTPYTINASIAMADAARSRGVFIPLHRGAGGFMSNKQFEKFYWPCLKALIQGLIDAGLIPIPLLEGDYTPRLEYLAELPRAKVVGHFDVIDRHKAKKTVGDVMCYWGNVPASIMCTGTPAQVKDDVKALIDMFGDSGLIIDSTVGIPDEAKRENVQALSDAVREYGIT